MTSTEELLIREKLHKSSKPVMPKKTNLFKKLQNMVVMKHYPGSSKNGKRIKNKSMLTHLTPPVTLLLYTVASEATPLNPNRTKPSLID